MGALAGTSPHLLDVAKILASKMSTWQEVITNAITCALPLVLPPHLSSLLSAQTPTYSRNLDPVAPRCLSVVANAFFLVYVPGPREVSPVPIVFVFRVLSGQCRKNLNAQDGLDVGPGQGVGILVCLPSRMPPLVPVRKLHGRE